MKNKFFLFIFSLIISAPVFSQNCEQMLPFKQGASVTYKNYDEKQKLTGSHKQTFTKVTSDGDKVVSTVKLETYDKKGDAQDEPMEYTIKCQKGMILMDLSKAMPKGSDEMYKNMEVKIKGDDLEYPSTFTVGHTLKNAKMQMEIINQGTAFATMNYEVFNRKVEAKETIITPAGTFVCYKITEEYKSETIMNMMGMSIPGIKVNGKTVQWYCIEAGAVKTESYNEKGNLQGVTILEEIKK